MADQVGQFFDAGDVFQGLKLYDKAGAFLTDANAAPPTPPPDVTPPVVTYVSPTPGGTLAPTDAVVVDVSDDSGIVRRAMLAVAFTDGTQELAYDGTAFTARFGSSSVATMAGGVLRFSLNRVGGWSGSGVTVRAFAVDPSGNLES